MAKIRLWLLSSFLLVFFMTLAFAPMNAAAKATPAPVRHATVASAVAAAHPREYVGPPRYLVILVTARAYLRDNDHSWTKIVYRFQRSNHTFTQFQTRWVAPGQRSVDLTDHLYIPPRTHNGWNYDQLLVVQPNTTFSNPAYFYIRWR